MGEVAASSKPGFDQRPSHVKGAFEGQTGRFVAVNVLRSVASGALLAGLGIGIALGVRKVIQLRKGLLLQKWRTIGIGASGGALAGVLPVWVWIAVGLHNQRTYRKAIEGGPLVSGEVEPGGPGLKVGEFAPCRIEGPFDERRAAESKLELIRSADQTIRWAQAFGGGPTLESVLNAMEEQLEQKPTLHIRFMINGNVMRRCDKKQIRSLAERYPDRFSYLICKQPYLVYPRVRRISHHVKLVVVDAQRFQVGGTEDFGVKDPGRPDKSAGGLFANVSGAGGLADMDVRGEGQQMGQLLAEQFDELWQKWHRIMGVSLSSVSLATHPDMQSAPHPEAVDAAAAVHLYSPGHGEQNGWVEAVKSRLETLGPGSTVWIGNMSYNGRRVLRLVAEAANRGVTVKVVTNGRSGLSPIANMMHGPLNRSHYAELGQKAEIYEYPQKDRLYHKKVWVFCPANDVPTVFIGSANISEESITSADEIMLEIRSAELAERCIQSLQDDIEGAAPVSAEKIEEYAHGWNRFEAVLLAQVFENVTV